MNRKTKMIIFSIILLFAIIQKQSKETNVIPENNSPITNNTKPTKEELYRLLYGKYATGLSEEDINEKIKYALTLDTDIFINAFYQKYTGGAPSENQLNYINSIILQPLTFYSTPQNGYSPYDYYFGKGIYNNSSNNSFKIKNSNTTDAVVLLVNAYSKRKVRNEFVRKGATFEMTGVPNGTYYLEWFSGNDWSPELKVGSKYKGGFRSKASFTKTKDATDWMKVSGNQVWTVTLYTVAGGDVESESMNANEFFN